MNNGKRQDEGGLLAQAADVDRWSVLDESIATEDPAVFVVNEDGFALRQPQRAFDIEAWVPDVAAFVNQTGFAFPSSPSTVAMAYLTVTRYDQVPQVEDCAWWRRQVRDAGILNDDDEDDEYFARLHWQNEVLTDDGYADCLAWAAGQLMTDRESTILRDWLRSEFGRLMVVGRRKWITLAEESWTVPVDYFEPWRVDLEPAYPLPFKAEGRPSWLLLD
jgi:hypothetical protein